MPLFENSRREATVVVTVYETLPDVLARLRGHSNSTVVLEIPQGSPLFLTGTEFRSLREVAQQRRINISLATDDPLRVQLAGVFSLPVLGADHQPDDNRRPLPPPSWEGNQRPPPVPNRSLDSGSRSGRAPDERQPPDRRMSTRERAIWPSGRPSSMPGPVPNRTLPADESGFEDGSAQSSGSRRAVREDSGVRWPTFSHEPPGGPRPSGDSPQTGRASDAPEGRSSRDSIDDARPARGPVETGRPRLASGSGRGGGLSTRGLLGIAAGIIAAVLVLTLVLGMFVFSSAQVEVTLAAGRVTGNIDCEIVEPGQTGSASVVVEGQVIEAEVEWTGSVPTTGTRPEPDAPAMGRVELRNPNAEAVTIEAGTELTGINDQIYTVTNEVTVAAGNPALSEFGSGEAVVEATVGGTGGNLGPGEVGGRLENGVYYSNRSAAMTGGSDREIPVVQPADIQALHEQATAALREQVAAGQGLGLESGITIIPATVSISEPSFTDDLQAGDDGEQISTTATATATVLSYEDRALRNAATEQLVPILEQQVPAGSTLAASTVQITQTTVTGQTETGASLDVQGIANIQTTLSDADADALADRLAGESPSDVNTILTEDTRFASYDVSYSPGWLPDRMPSSADRIDVVVRQ
ncbi:MAG TPA: hypothetical protein VGT61_09355 [Thermomicrobiales bacterium]|jgi:hypothetical protein|nr:hypothetical protein [Thermomicrobiales bacterium]